MVHMNTRDLFSLKGKTILITGGAGLYDKCIFQALLECGGTVITASTSIDNAKKLVDEFRSKGLDAHAKQVDQADHQSIIKLKCVMKKKLLTLDKSLIVLVLSKI